MDLLDLYAKITLDSSEYKEGIQEADAEADSLSNNLLGKFSKAGAVAGKTLAGAGAAAVATGVVLAKNTMAVAEYGDNIDKMSQKMGVSSTFYQEWDAIMQHSGTTMEGMKTSFKTLADASAETTKTQQAAFEALGLSMDEVHQMGQEELFETVITRLQDMGEGAERTAIAADLLGKGAVEMGALLNTSAEDTLAMKQAVHDLGGVMSEDAVKASAQFQDNLQDLKTGFSGIKNELGVQLMPILNTFMEWGVEKMPAIQEGASAVFSAIGTGVEYVVGAIQTLLGWVETAWNWLSETASATVEVVGQAANNLGFFGMAGEEMDPAAVMAYMDAQMAAAEQTANTAEVAEATGETIGTMGEVFGEIAEEAESGTSSMEKNAQSNLENMEADFHSSMSNAEQIFTQSMANMQAMASAGININVNTNVAGGQTIMHAKAMSNAYMLTGATIFGRMGGQNLGGGENGHEIVIGENTLYNSIRDASGTSGMTVYLRQMVDLMQTYLPKAANNKVFSPNGTFIGEMASGVSREMGNRYMRAVRGSV